MTPVSYFITTAGHSSFEPETDTRLRTIMNELPPITSSETASPQCGEMMRHAQEPADAVAGCKRLRITTPAIESCNYRG